MTRFLSGLLKKKNQQVEINTGKYGFFPRLWRQKNKKGLEPWVIMAIALVPLVLVQQVSRSMIEGITRRIIETDSYHLIFEPYKKDILANDTEREVFVSQFESIDGITNAYAELRGLGILRKGNVKTGVSIRGISSDLLEDKSFLKYVNTKQGVFAFENENDAVLGEALALKLNAEIGDTVLILTTRASDIQSLPKISRLRVVGIISTGYEELDRTWVFTPLQKAKSLIPPEDAYWFIGMKLADPFILANDIVIRSKEMREKGLGIYARAEELMLKEGRVNAWFTMNYNRFLLFVETQKNLSFVMFIAVLLAVVTLSSTMSMKVIDLEVEIAMLKAIGANPKRLEWQLFVQGFRYGVIGSLCGAAIGVVMTLGVNQIIYLIDGAVNIVRRIFGHANAISILNPEYYLAEVPTKLYPMQLLVIMVLATMLAVFAAWLPARRLRKISPLRMIRMH